MSAYSARDERLLDRLLETLLDLPQEERARRIANLAEKQPHLAERLARLLALAEQEATTLPPAGALHPGLLGDLLADGAPMLEAGEDFCGFRIEALIGRGGMSEVYRASRAYDGFAATVALKLIHRDAGRELRAETLRHEQRALARLEHPGIARFIDAGVGPQGDLWLAMEHVDGEPILAHADRLRLDLRARARLLVELCRALEHAHARRLVHGDVKSANVLVDSEQRLRLVDFGISSDASSGESGSVRAFTPECAAPEQLGGRGITTATDVFQVGALAYRLLGGRSRLGAGAVAAAGETALVAPSVALAAVSAEDADVLAQARSLPRAATLRRALAGDLDAIVLRCLQPDPERRYAGCAELREDLEAWLATRRVRARRGGVGLRIGRFLSRHAFAATAVALAAMAALVASGFALHRVREAQLERLAEAERAIQVERFLSETFRAASPYLRDDASDPLATIAALGDDLLRDAAGLDPRTRARLGLSLAQLHLARGEYATARALLEAAEAQAGETPALRAELLSARAASEASADDTDAAIRSQREAVRLLQSAGVPPLQRALAQGQLGELLRRAGLHDEAGAAFAAAMPPVLADFADAGIDRVRVVDRYVRHLSQAGKLDGLRELRAQLAPRAGREDARGLADAELGSVMAEIDSLLSGPGVAAPAFELAAQRFEALLGGAHPRVARALTDACVSRLESGEMARARDLCLRGLAIYRGSSGADSANAAVAASNLAVIAYNSGLLPEAERHSERSGEVFERLRQPDMQVHGRLLAARIAIAHGRYAQALRELDRAATLHAAAMADNDVYAIEIAQQRAFALLGLGRPDEAATALDAAAPALERILPADRARNRAWTGVARAQVAGARGDVATLDRLAAAALADYRATPGNNDLELGWLQAELAQAARTAGQHAAAVTFADGALERMTPEANGAHWAQAWATRRLCGGAADANLDARARDLLVTQQVDTSTARDFLALPR
jgi:hypothetical protein